MHRIEGLSEHFVYFNDDFFLVNDARPTDFFVKGLPRSTVGLRKLELSNPQFAAICENGYALINRHFKPRELRKGWSVFLDPRSGLRRVGRTITLIPQCRDAFPGFYEGHGPNAFLKSTLETVWREEPEILAQTSSHKFRTMEDVNQYIFESWQWFEGAIRPSDRNKLFSCVSTRAPDDVIFDALLNKKTPVVVVNDVPMPFDFEQKKAAVNGVFDRILGEKSSFEL